MIRYLSAGAPLGSALVWAAALMVDAGPWDSGSVLLIGLGVILTGLVSIVGTMLSGGQWARNLAIATLSAGLLIALARPADRIWAGAVVVTAIGLVLFGLPPVRAMTRKLASASGPPERAVVVTTVLLGAPFLIGFAAWSSSNWATVVTGVSAPIVALWYSRVLPGGLYACRYGWPFGAVVLAFLQAPGAAIASAVLGLIVGVAAHDSSVKVAFYPPREAGTAYPIPPELAPKEILDAAHMNDEGRKP